MITNSQRNTEPNPDIVTPQLHREALRSYILWLRTHDPKERRVERMEYERTFNEVIESSPDKWRIFIPNEKEREQFTLKFGIDTKDMDLNGISYSKENEASQIVFSDPDILTDQIEIPITHLPDEYRLLTKDELMKVL